MWEGDMKFKNLLKILTEAVIKDKTLSSGSNSVTVALEELSGGKFRVSVKGSISGHTDYESKGEAEKRYKSLDSYAEVAKWLGKSSKTAKRRFGFGGHHHKKKPTTGAGSGTGAGAGDGSGDGTEGETPTESKKKKK